MDDIKSLLKRFELSEKEVDNISNLIIATYTRGASPTKKPQAVILGGQPGSGKGELITQAQKIIGSNIVVCNADDYRVMHPHFKTIVQEFEDIYPELTASYAQIWNNRLREHCESRNLNYILETTFSSGTKMNETIQQIKEKGYQVSVMILAVNQHLSFLGTRMRYELMYGRDGYGRTVAKNAHDERYEKIIPTLHLVEKDKLDDHIYIYARASRQRLKGTVNGLRLVSMDSDSPSKDYKTERSKKWSENDLRYFTGDILLLFKSMVLRQATHKELEQLFTVFDLEDYENLLAPDVETDPES
jgi:predicted ABC-type ATPase